MGIWNIINVELKRMVRIGEEISTDKGNGIVRGTIEMTDGRYVYLLENKNKHYFLAIEGDDF